MPTTSEIREATMQYVAGRWDFDYYRGWLLRNSLEGFSDCEAEMLSNKIEGLLAEASHTEWTERDIREELAVAIRPFVSTFVLEKERHIGASMLTRVIAEVFCEPLGPTRRIDLEASRSIEPKYPRSIAPDSTWTVRAA